MSKCTECKNYHVTTKVCNFHLPGRFVGQPDKDLPCRSFEQNYTEQSVPTETIRQFDTGAIRSNDVNKLDYEGFFSPIVLQRYAQYLHKHRIQADGQIRDADNWQKGIPIKEYMRSKTRHIMAIWLIHRGFDAFDEKGNKLDIEDSLCAEIFNAMGHLFEILKGKQK